MQTYIVGVKYRIDLGSGPPNLSKHERTPSGGLRLPANVTRTGVFRYVNEDGSVIRELRHPDEVFAPASLATLPDAPLTLGHPGTVTPSSWKKDAVGYVRSANADGKFVAANLIVQDADTVAAIENKKLVELSCGYTCDVVMGKGVYDGEEYDAAQSNIRYNHVGLGPEGWGRAGKDVKVKYDGLTFDVGGGAPDAAYIGGMDPKELERLRADAAEAAVLRADRDAARGERDAAKADVAKLQSELSKLQGERDALKADAAPEKFSAAVAARVSVLDGARKVLGDKVDATKSDAELIASVLVAHDASFKADGLSVDYLRGRFDSVVKGYASTASQLAGLQANIAGAHNAGADATDKTDGISVAADATAAFKAKQAEAWRTK